MKYIEEVHRGRKVLAECGIYRESQEVCDIYLQGANLVGVGVLFVLLFYSTFFFVRVFSSLFFWVGVVFAIFKNNGKYLTMLEFDFGILVEFHPPYLLSDYSFCAGEP